MGALAKICNFTLTQQLPKQNANAKLTKYFYSLPDIENIKQKYLQFLIHNNVAKQ